MKIRYLLGKINQNADNIEIDEALELLRIYNEDQTAHLCPALGAI